MNLLETIANSNEKNHALYLKRMRESVYRSSKKLIIEYALSSERILDVGCGDGALIGMIDSEQEKKAIFLGVDINSKSIEQCPSMPNASFETCGIESVAERIADGRLAPFDCVIFSSVLHEISSYDPDHPFTLIPVKRTLECANACLADGGIMIVRDGVWSPDERRITAVFNDPRDIRFALDYAVNAPLKPEDYGIRIMEDSASVSMSWSHMQEFLRTYTWGAESWHREIRELNGIATPDVWEDVFRESGFETVNRGCYEDGYSAYLVPKVRIYEDGAEVPLEERLCCVNGVWVAVKKERGQTEVPDKSIIQ